MARSRLPVWLTLALTAGAVAWAWAGLPGRPAACLPAGCDCEAAGPGPIRQPANAWSALSLTAAGLVLLSVSPAGAGETRSLRERRGASHAGTSVTHASPPPPNPLPHQRVRRAGTLSRRLAAGALVAAGWGAFLYHAGLTAWAARLDGITVGVLAGALGLHAITRLRPLPGGRLLPANPWRSLVPWLLMVLGAACWWLGQTGEPWCRPESLWQAHAAWHLLAAAAAVLWLAPRRDGPQPPAPSSLRAERPARS